MTHPCADTPFREWLRDDAGRKLALAVDRYFERTVLRTDWRGWACDFPTAAVHATAVRARPDLEDAARVPDFVILDLVRWTRNAPGRLGKRPGA